MAQDDRAGLERQVNRTPSPWAVVNSRKEFIVTGNDGLYDVAIVRNIGNHGNHGNLANAQLIAAAPDLLAALKECADYLSCIPESAAGGDDDAVRLQRMAMTAIKRAEGMV